MPDPIKKIINNGNLVAHLAPCLKVPEAKALAEAAQTYRAILHDFGIKADTTGFDGCDEAKQLVQWISSPVDANPVLLKRWTADIWLAIADLAAGKLPGS